MPWSGNSTCSTSEGQCLQEEPRSRHRSSWPSTPWRRSACEVANGGSIVAKCDFSFTTLKSMHHREKCASGYSGLMNALKKLAVCDKVNLRKGVGTWLDSVPEESLQRPKLDSTTGESGNKEEAPQKESKRLKNFRRRMQRISLQRMDPNILQTSSKHLCIFLRMCSKIFAFSSFSGRTFSAKSSALTEGRDEVSAKSLPRRGRSSSWSKTAAQVIAKSFVISIPWRRENTATLKCHDVQHTAEMLRVIVRARQVTAGYDGLVEIGVSCEFWSTQSRRLSDSKKVLKDCKVQSQTNVSVESTVCDRPNRPKRFPTQSTHSSGLGISVAFPHLTAVFQRVQGQEGQEGQEPKKNKRKFGA